MRKLGFSLAEALITLMIVSLILAAVLPVMSKKQNTVDSMWRYASNNSDIYFGNNTSQSAVIGDSSVPAASKGSKLVIVTPEDKDGDTIQRSLIDFYQKTSTGMENIGRIAFDRNDTGAAIGYGNSGNIAIGKNALINNAQVKNSSYGNWNTAVGSEALYTNTTGWHNTAFGDRVLYNNLSGRDNVAVGSKSQFYTFDTIGNTSLGSFSLGGYDSSGARTKLQTGSYNTAIGYLSLYQNVTGEQNVAVGTEALRDNTGSSRNTAIGFHSISCNTTGYDNTGLGVGSMGQNTVGNENTAIGADAMEANIDGEWNTSIGSASMRRNTSGKNNVAVGTQSMHNNQIGEGNVVIGVNAMFANESSSEMTAVGFQALRDNKTGTTNTAIGAYSLLGNVSGWSNTAVGSWALSSNISGADNTAVGLLSLSRLTSGGCDTAFGERTLEFLEQGDFNTALGHESSRMLRLGSGNTAIGHQSLINITSGGGNVALGSWAGPTGNTSNQLFIDNSTRNDSLIWGDFSTRQVKINGTLTTTSTLFTPTGTVSTSDKRLKNIVGDYNLGLERILKLRVKEYTFKNSSKGGYDKRKHTGVIAQELQKIIPNAVVEGPGNDKYKTLLYIDQSEILFACVNAIKQLYKKIVNTNERINSLEEENIVLKQKIMDDKKRIQNLDERLKKLENKAIS